MGVEVVLAFCEVGAEELQQAVVVVVAFVHAGLEVREVAELAAGQGGFAQEDVSQDFAEVVLEVDVFGEFQ